MLPDLNGKAPAIAPGSLVLVTGANGFIASHVADQLMQAGYRVRGTSRDTTKTQWIQELFDKRYGAGKFEAVVVKDMAEEGAFDDACKGRFQSTDMSNAADSCYVCYKVLLVSPT